MKAKRVLFAMSVTVAVLVFAASPAVAHVDLIQSQPGDGVNQTGLVRTIVLEFSTAAVPAGTGVEVLLPDGTVVMPDDLSSTDGVIWSASFDNPLPAGTIGVRWTMRAGDAHPRTGGFSFDVAPSESAAERIQPAMVDSKTALDEFLADQGGDGLAGAVGSVGRVLGMLGIVLGIGVLVFAATVLRGSHDDVRHSVFWVRRFSVAGLVGSAVEVAALAASQSGLSGALNPLTYGSLAVTFAGAAVLLRLVGAGGLLLFSRQASVHADVGVDMVSAVARSLPASAIVGGPASLGHRSHDLANPVRFDRSTSRLAFAAAGVAVLSFAIDGHTVTEGTFIFTAVAAAVHVVAGSIWAGGVVALALTARRRRIRTGQSDLLPLAVRFSVVASLAVVAVGVAGLVLTVTIIDSVDVLWSTTWGRLLMVKVSLVGVAGAMGFHNHRTLIPRYLVDADGAATRGSLRRAVSVEAVILSAAILVTALLVASSAV